MNLVRLALSFLTRLPLPADPADGALPSGALAAAMRYFPVAGVIVGFVGASVYVIAHWFFATPLAALLSIAATAAITGGLHEDGLADTIDGFGGGRTKDAKLAIMRDSRIGSYGVLAIVVSVLLRAAALSNLGTAAAVGGALLSVHALARTAIPFALTILPPARPDGLGAAAGRPTLSDRGIAATIAIGIAALVLTPAAALAAIIGAAGGAAAVIAIAHREIGGQTGDVLGAVEQVAEVGGLLCVAAVLPHPL